MAMANSPPPTALVMSFRLISPPRLSGAQRRGQTSTLWGILDPAQIVVSQTELKLVADDTANATTATIKSDQQQVEAAQELEADEANISSVDFVA